MYVCGGEIGMIVNCIVNAEDMDVASQAYQAELHREGVQVDLRDEINEYGWYSANVMSFVFRWKIAENEFGLSTHLMFDATNPVAATDAGIARLRHPDALGLVVNIDNRHWVAFRKHNDDPRQFWYLDSQAAGAVLKSTDFVKDFIARNRGAFLIADDA